MIFRLLSIISLLAMSPSVSNSPSDDEKMGGEGFGGVVLLFTGLAVLVVAVVLVLGVLALTGQFESDTIDPAT